MVLEQDPVPACSVFLLNWKAENDQKGVVYVPLPCQTVGPEGARTEHAENEFCPETKLG